MRRLTILTTAVLAAAASGQGPELDRFTLDGEITSTALDPGDKHSFVGFADGSLMVFPVLDRMAQQLYGFPAHKKPVTAGAFLTEGKIVLSASLDGTVRVWDVETCVKYLKATQALNGRGRAAYPGPKTTISAHTSGVTAMVVRPDGNQFLTGGVDGSVKLWDVKTNKTTLTITGSHPGGVKAVAYRTGNEQVVTSGADKTVKVWDAKTGKPVGKSEPLKSAVNGMALSPDGKKVAVACAPAKKGGPGLVTVLDLETLKPDFTIEAHDEAVTCVVFHPKTPYLATGGADKTVRVWDLGTKERASMAENAEPLRGLAITPDGKRFVAISATRLRWWKGFGAKE